MLDAIDLYCERVAPGLWGEPLNTLTGLLFVLAGLIALRSARSTEDRLAALLLALVGVASALSHATAIGLTRQIDIIANLAWQTLLIALMLNRWGGVQPARASMAGGALLGTLTFAQLTPLTVALFGQALDTFAVLAFVTGLAAIFRRDRLLLLAAAALLIGLPFRFLDGALCEQLALGTHWLWHIANAIACATILIALQRPANLAKAGPQG